VARVVQPDAPRDPIMDQACGAAVEVSAESLMNGAAARYDILLVTGIRAGLQVLSVSAAFSGGCEARLLWIVPSGMLKPPHKRLKSATSLH
jgi:hypothetical protein